MIADKAIEKLKNKKSKIVTLSPDERRAISSIGPTARKIINDAMKAKEAKKLPLTKQSDIPSTNVKRPTVKSPKKKPPLTKQSDIPSTNVKRPKLSDKAKPSPKTTAKKTPKSTPRKQAKPERRSDLPAGVLRKFQGTLRKDEVIRNIGGVSYVIKRKDSDFAKKRK